MAVIVPPQSYFEVVQQHGYAGSFFDFMRLYASGYGGFCKRQHALPDPADLEPPVVRGLPVRLHAGAVVAAAAVAAGARHTSRRRWPGRCAARALLWLPIAVLAALRLALFDRYPPTHALIGDWYLHATDFGVFLLGAAWARGGTAWQRCADLRWPALALALGAWAVMLALSARSRRHAAA